MQDDRLTAVRSCHLFCSTLYLALIASCFALSGFGGRLGSTAALATLLLAAAAGGMDGVGEGDVEACWCGWKMCCCCDGRSDRAAGSMLSMSSCVADVGAPESEMEGMAQLDSE